MDRCYAKTILDDIGLEKKMLFGCWLLEVIMHQIQEQFQLKKHLMMLWLFGGQNGEALRPEQGYPVRLVVPGWEGNLNTKWLNRLEFSDKPWHAKRRDFKIYNASKIR